MGGLVPLGYEVHERQLVINEAEATTVRHLFMRYCELGSVQLLKEEVDRNGVRSKVRVSQDAVESGGQVFSRGALYTLLRNQSMWGRSVTREWASQSLGSVVFARRGARGSVVEWCFIRRPR
jgi:site-specific DNA recombinase